MVLRKIFIKYLFIFIVSLQSFSTFATPHAWDCFPLLEKVNNPINAPLIENTMLRRLEREWGDSSLYSLHYKMKEADIVKHNQRVLEALKEDFPNIETPYMQAITPENASYLVDLYIKHPVVGKKHHNKYDPDGCLGLCFGRAFITHMEALRRNVHPEAIKKLWVVGFEPESGDGFHVTTLIRTKNSPEQWLALDPNFGRAVTLQTWLERYYFPSIEAGYPQSLFVTDAYRFAVHSSRNYNRIDLFGIEGTSDFYRGFFKDYVDSMLKEPTPEPFSP